MFVCDNTFVNGDGVDGADDDEVRVAGAMDGL